MPRWFARLAGHELSAEPTKEADWVELPAAVSAQLTEVERRGDKSLVARVVWKPGGPQLLYRFDLLALTQTNVTTGHSRPLQRRPEAGQRPPPTTVARTPPPTTAAAGGYRSAAARRVPRTRPPTVQPAPDPSQRWWDHRFPDFGDQGAAEWSRPTPAELRGRAAGLLEQLQTVRGTEPAVPNSVGEWVTDWTVYTGVAGVALAELRACWSYGGGFGGEDAQGEAARVLGGGGGALPPELAEAAELRRQCAEVQAQLPDDSRMQLGDLPQPWETVGQGCFGAVYRCRCEPVADMVAVKELLNPMDSPSGGRTLRQLRQRLAFLKEIRNLSMLRRGQILSFYGWGETAPGEDGSPGKLFMVTEFCAGGGLAALLQAGADAMNDNQRAALACDCGVPVAQALAYIHRKRLVHLDVSARNVLVDDAGRYKLADAGLLCPEGDPAPVICVAWSPPEQVRCPSAERVAAASHDAWSYGMLLYEVLTCSMPFAELYRDCGGDVPRWARGAAAELLAGRHPPRPESAADGAAAAVWEEVVVGMWHEDPARRPAVKDAVHGLAEVRRAHSADGADLLSLRTGSSSSGSSWTGTAGSCAYNLRSLDPLQPRYTTGYTEGDLRYSYPGASTSGSLELEPAREQGAGAGDAALAEAHLRRARELAEVSAAAAKDSAPRHVVSFLLGPPGAFAVAAAAAEAQGDVGAAEAHAAAVADWADPAVALEDASTLGGEDEFLFGRAGYLYAVQWMERNAPRSSAAHSGRLAAGARAVAERCVASGRRLSEKRYKGQPPLVWHCHGHAHLGAAHGPCGVLAALLRCLPLLSAGSQDAVRHTVYDLLGHQMESGDLPALRGKMGMGKLLVHWCHGAAGLPLLAQLAERAFGEPERFREVACRAADAVWERGLVRKGHGLCHGAAGNTYALLTAARMLPPGEEREQLLYRVWRFVEALDDPEYKAACASWSDRQRVVDNIPDSPLSLMEGVAGTACLLLDMGHPESARFPGWEI